MRRRWGAVWALVGVVGLVLFLPFAVTATAQDDTGDDGGENPALDAIRAAVPEGFPGEYDVQEGDADYLQLVALFGEDTIVSDFGDGSELTGQCGGFAYSYDKDGELIDAAVDFGDDDPPIDIGGDNFGDQAFTSGNRFQVDTEGVVTYFGFLPEVGDGPEDHRWEITTEGISLDSGGDPNPDFKNRNAGLVDLANDLPDFLKTNFNARVEGNLTSVNGLTCMGAGHVEFSGPFFNIISAAGLALAGAGVIGLLFNSRPAMTWRA